MTESPNPLDTWIEDPSTTPAPKRPSKVALETVDQARAWMCYAAFSGDIEKTAIASKVPLSAIQALEHDFNWPAKLKRLKTGAGESDAERVANRAINYLQAQRMREVMERTLKLVEDPEELIKVLVKFKFAEEGDLTKIDVNPKAILDLSKALETVQNMSYRALGDKVPSFAETVKASDKGVGGSTNVANVRQVLSMLTEMHDSRVANITVPPAPADEASSSDSTAQSIS